MVASNHTPICEIPEAAARSLVFDLGELLGLFVCDRGAVSEAAE
ncbi:hypothetical protein [Streptomyces sp. A3M-1-3]|nr:hypothetical protein [Streptomyces sp. A3M-1-3]